MKRLEAIVAAVLAMSLSGCVLKNKPQQVAAAPAPPRPEVAPPAPPPRTGLSAPQTQVELPPAQPLTTEAIATTIPPEETANAAPARPSTSRPGRKGASNANSAAAQHTEPVGPPSPTPAVATPAPAEPETRPAIGEIVPAAELRRLQSDATRVKREIHDRLQALGRRHLSAKEQDLKEQALSYVKRSDTAEKQGDMRMAYELASRGLVYAKALADAR